MSEVEYEWRKCRACNGSGRKLSGEKGVEAVFSFGASLVVDAMSGDSVMTRRCDQCGGDGEIKSVRRVRG